MSKTLPTTDTVISDLVPGSVKAAMKEAGASSADLWMVPYDQLRVIDGFNVRVRTPDYIAHVKSIKDSIIANGFYRDKPLEGYVGKDEEGHNVIFITGGHTRHEAVGLAIAEGHEIDSVPVIVKPQGTSQEDLTVALVTGNTGRPLTPIETAIVIKRLIGFGMDEKTIAQRLGYGKQYVTDLLSLLAAPAAVRKLVESGKVSATLAISEIKKDPKQAAQKLTEAVEKVSAQGKTKVTKKALAGARVKPVVGEFYAPHTENGEEGVAYVIVKVPADRADDIDRKKLKIVVVGDIEPPAKTKAAKKAKAKPAKQEELPLTDAADDEEL